MRPDKAVKADANGNQRAVPDPRPDGNIVCESESALHAHGFRVAILRCCAALRGYYARMVADTCPVMVRIRGETAKRSDMRAM